MRLAASLNALGLVVEMRRFWKDLARGEIVPLGDEDSKVNSIHGGFLSAVS